MKLNSQILAIVNPETNETVNQNAVEASKKEEDAPKAEKEEGTVHSLDGSIINFLFINIKYSFVVFQ